MQPRIETLSEKKLIGKCMRMSLLNNTTSELWKGFMQRRKEVNHTIGNNLYSIQTYDPLYFTNFNRATEFEKWAAIEVTDFNAVPNEMETFILPAGLYVVFLYKGTAANASATFQYIFGTWLPASAYLLDDRPHFEVLGEKYKNDDADSEEEIWIPVKK
jgi:AraC family transcriptional regulator